MTSQNAAPPPKSPPFHAKFSVFKWVETSLPSGENKQNPNQSRACSALLLAPGPAQQQAHLEGNGPGKEVMAGGGLGAYAFHGKDKQFLPFG